MTYKHKQVDNRLFVSLEPSEVVHFFESMRAYGLRTVETTAFKVRQVFAHGQVREVEGIENLPKLLMEKFHVSNFTVEGYTGQYDTVVIGVERNALADYLDKDPGHGKPISVRALDENDRSCDSWEYVSVPYKDDYSMEYLIIHLTTGMKDEFSPYVSYSGPKRLLGELIGETVGDPLKKLSVSSTDAESVVLNVMLPLWSRFEASIALEISYINEYYAKARRGQPIEIVTMRMPNDPWYIRVVIKTKGHYTVR